MKSSRLLLPWLLIAALVAAPLAPLSAAAPGGDGAHHTLHGAAEQGAHDDHAPAANSSCDRHQACQGQCCAACAQCFTAVFTLSPSFLPTLTILSPTVPQLHERLPVAPHDRPPAV